MITLGAVAVIYAAFATAPYVHLGIIEMLSHFKDGINIEDICVNRETLKVIIIYESIYFATVLAFLNRETVRREDQFGSASFEDPENLRKKYNKGEGKILSEHVNLSFDSRFHGRNLNVLVCGGSGSGKTRFYALPNVMSANSSYVILDPKGEILKTCGALLESEGYTVKVIDLINMERSDCYNPFRYIKDENDAQRLCTNLFANTTPKDAKSSDPFWEKAAMMLLLAVVFYLMYEAPEYEQNFSTVLDMIRALDIDEDHASNECTLDKIFKALPDDHIAKRYYKTFRTGSGKTLKSIQISLLSHLEKFNLTSLSAITRFDEMELDTVGERKTAIFAVTSENDTSFNFIIGILYTQLFQQLYRKADGVYGGALPYHVHFNLDEFANMPLPDDFDKILSTMRSRNISVSIIIQNMAQLKALYKESWESIVGNCDTFLYLGGNELSTHEYVSKLIGKETVRYMTHSKGRGGKGSFTESEYIAARSLMNPDEVRTLNNTEAILFIRGEKAAIDRKYNILRHKNAPKTPIGAGKEYIREKQDYSCMTVRLTCQGTLAIKDEKVADNTDFPKEEETEIPEVETEIVSDIGEIEKIIMKRTKEDEKNNN